MNFKIFLIISVLFHTGWKSSKKEVEIDGKVLDKNIVRIEYTIPVKGIFNGLMADSVIPDASGKFHISVPVEKPEFIILRPLFKTNPIYKTQGVIIAEPGKTYQAVFDSTSNNESFKVLGENGSAINQYNKLQKSILLSIGTEIKPFMKDSVASSIRLRITEQRDKEIAIFKNMADKGDISGDFFKLVQTDRYLYYSVIMAIVIQTKFEVCSRNPNLKFTKELAQVYKFKDEMKEIWEEAFKTSNIQPVEIAQSPWWFPYYKSYVYFKAYSNKELTAEMIKDLVEKNLFKTFQINNGAKKYVPASLFESYFANDLFYECFMGNNDEYELISLYDQFVSEYPNSVYKRFLTPFIEKNKNFHRKIMESKADENIRFIDSYQDINSLRECLKSFKGKKVYIDVWASWCGSCRVEFSKKVKVDDILKSKGIEMLYISVDEDNFDKNWKDLIKYYDLKGYHIRASKSFADELRKLQSANGPFYIPWHIMINEAGNVTNLPKEIEDLFKESN